ncbi:MAG: hypothetical protein ABJO67_17715 [Pseudoruegeria sp.]
MEPIAFETSGKNQKNYVALGGLGVALILLILLQANIWFLLMVQALAGLLIWEILTDRPAQFRLDRYAVSWVAGRQDVRIALAEIDVVRVSKKLDFSHSVSIVTKDGNRLSIPWECLPDIAELTRWLGRADITVKKSLFSFG